MSEYGSLRQYRNRVGKLLARGDTMKVAISCRSCAFDEGVCPRCDAMQDDWVKHLCSEAKVPFTWRRELSKQDLVR